MLSTPRRAIQYPDPAAKTDRADIATHISYVALAADVSTLFNQGTDAARQAAAHQAQGGRFWWATDTKIMWYDDGTNWQQILPTTPVNTQVASYTLTLADNNGIVEMNVGGANTLTVPNDTLANFAVGSSVTITQLGAGQTTLAAAGGVTLRSYNNSLRIAGQYGIVSVIKRAANDWYAAGNLVP